MNEEININENVSPEAAPAVAETKIDAVSEKLPRRKPVLRNELPRKLRKSQTGCPCRNRG